MRIVRVELHVVYFGFTARLTAIGLGVEPVSMGAGVSSEYHRIPSDAHTAHDVKGQWARSLASPMSGS